MQAVLRNVRTKGYAELYLAKGSFYVGVRMLLALALVPADKKLEYFESLLQAKLADPHFLEFALQYFKTTWLDGYDLKV